MESHFFASNVVRGDSAGVVITTVSSTGARYARTRGITKQRPFQGLV